MGNLPERAFLAGLDESHSEMAGWDVWRSRTNDEDELQPQDAVEIGVLGNVRETTAKQIVLRGAEVRIGGRSADIERAFYDLEIPIEFGVWARSVPSSAEHATDHSWLRLEAHSSAREIRAGDAFIVAEIPFEARRRYHRSSFRSALRKHTVPYFGPKFPRCLADKLANDSPSLRAVQECVEDLAVVSLDPFSTGDKRVAGISWPSDAFDDNPGGYGWPKGRGERGRTGWAFGTCRDADNTHRAVLLELGEIVEQKARIQARDRGISSDGSLLLALRPNGERVVLTQTASARTARLLPHAAWLAMAGVEDEEPIPQDNSVAAAAFRRLNDLLYNLDRRVKTYARRG